MTASYHHNGDIISVSGHGNIGAVKFSSQEAADPQAAVRELASLVVALHCKVAADDRQVLDESVRAVQMNASSDRSALRRALSNVIGIATMAGAAGAPALDAALKVKELFGA